MTYSSSIPAGIKSQAALARTRLAAYCFGVSLRTVVYRAGIVIVAVAVGNGSFYYMKKNGTGFVHPSRGFQKGPSIIVPVRSSTR